MPIVSDSLRLGIIERLNHDAHAMLLPQGGHNEKASVVAPDLDRSKG